MRHAEWIDLLVFAFLTILAWSRKLPTPRRVKATAIGIFAIAATLLTGLTLPRTLSPLTISVIRDWLPTLLLIMVYWQAGQFFLRIDERAQRRLRTLDERWVSPVLKWAAQSRIGIAILTYLELAYLFCYPMVPMALGTLYLLRMGHEADRFWTVVLLATYASYTMVPFIQTLPPRMLPEHQSVLPASNPVRRFNLWILRHGSIHANTFPSAHVAASLACALVLLSVDPLVGFAFLWMAVSIALGAVAGRYHYAADAVLGTLAALCAFALVTAVS